MFRLLELQVAVVEIVPAGRRNAVDVDQADRALSLIICSCDCIFRWMRLHKLRLILTILALIWFGAGSASADCRDYPGPGVDWSGCSKSRRLMAKQDFRGANLQGADLSDSDLSGANLSKANLSDATMLRTHLAGANMRDVSLTKAILDRADLTGADLSGADASKAELHRADISGALLVGTKMEKTELGRANLEGSNLSDAVLIRAYLVRADLRNARFAGANLTEAELDLADLRGADLYRSIGLVQDQLVDSCGDSTTKLPSGLVPPPNWPCARAEDGE
jgi:uncharacterized protein YjbI with pentapeptide repeats